MRRVIGTFINDLQEENILGKSVKAKRKYITGAEKSFTSGDRWAIISRKILSICFINLKTTDEQLLRQLFHF